jgi:tellurite resistance protein
VLVGIFLALTVTIGGLITGQWIVGNTPQDSAHPGYLLPTAVGGLVGAYSAGAVRLHAVSAISFGIGVVCWVLIGATVLGRLFFRPLPPAALIPTLAIEILPPAMAGNAWFELDGSRVDVIAYAIAGYTIVIAVLQLRLLPVYRRLSFTPGFWVFTFSFGAAANLVLAWLRITRPAGAAGWAVTVVTLITVLTGAVAVRTVVAFARGQFLPAKVPATSPRPVAVAGTT